MIIVLYQKKRLCTQALAPSHCPVLQIQVGPHPALTVISPEHHHPANHAVRSQLGWCLRHPIHFWAILFLSISPNPTVFRGLFI